MIHSGKYGQINGINTMRQWTIADTMNPAKAVASNTKLGTARRAGVRSWSGSYQAYGGYPVVMPGATFSFIGYGSPDNDVAGAVGLRYAGTGLVKSVAITWNWNSGELINHTVQFDGHLELAKASGVDPGDTTVPKLLPMNLPQHQWAAGDLTNFANIPNLTHATLTISVATEAYVNSSTIVNGNLWTGQVAGPLDWTLALSQQDTERLTSIFDIGDTVKLKLFIDATNFWTLTYGFIRDFSGITVNRETGAIIARTINVDMNGYYGSNSGFVLLPDGSNTQFWPFS